MAVTQMHGGTFTNELHSWRLKVYMQTALFVPVTGITVWSIYRSRPTEAPAVLITPTMTQIDAVNFPGLYEAKLSLTDVSIIGSAPGEIAFKFHDTTPGTAQDTIIVAVLLPRSAWVAP